MSTVPVTPVRTYLLVFFALMTLTLLTVGAAHVNIADHLPGQVTDAINVEFYTDVNQTLPDPVLLAPMLDTDSIVGKKILVVDDVADSGRTLGLVIKLLRGFGIHPTAAAAIASA